MRGWRIKRGWALAMSIALTLWSWDGKAETFPDEQIEQGRRLYKQFCQRCHGPNMVTSNPSTYDLRKFPPNARDRFVLSIVKGKGTMPSWGDILSQEEITDLYAYICQGKK